MPIVTTNVKAVSDAEIARANSLETSNAALAITADALAKENVELRRQLAAATAPPVVVPPVTPPLPGRTGLYVDGATLRTRTGAAIVVRGIELMVGTDVANRGFGALLADMKALGANAVSPLFQGQYGSTANVKAFCDAARAIGLLVGVNADHQPNGRAWLCAADKVALLNGYDHVFLECEVETDQTTSSAQWSIDAQGLVAALRAAGHRSLIKAGAPLGGRMVKHPLARGAEVLAADPLKNVCFTWQAYWKKATGGWQYSEDNGFAAGIAGSKAAVGACAASGLCFLIGLDWRDDVGETGVPELSAECDRLGVSYQYWVLFGDGMYPDNNLNGSWALTPAMITPTGVNMGVLLGVASRMAAL